MAHTPTAAQLTQLGVLRAAAQSAQANLSAAIANLTSAQSAHQTASKAVVDYQSYIYGGLPKSPGLDQGNPDAV